MSSKQDSRQGTCSKCGQMVDLAGIDESTLPKAADNDELATYACQCPDGAAFREAKIQEERNNQFTRFAEEDVKAWMQENELKRVAVRDSYGNSAVLLRMEKGEINATITSKRVMQA